MKCKNLIALLLVLVMALSLAACGNTPDPTEPPTDPTVPSTEKPTEKPTEAPTDPTDAPTDPTDAPTDPVETKEILFAWEENGACTFTFFVDGTYEFTYSKMGIVENGTWSLENWTMKIVQSNGVEVEAVRDAEDETVFVISYVSEISEKLHRDFRVTKDVWGPALGESGNYPAAEKAVLFAWEENGACTFTFFDDNTYEFTYSKMGIVENGTWSLENWTLKIVQSNGVEVEAVRDAEDETVFVISYVSEISEKLHRDFRVTKDVWGPALGESGNYPAA